MTAPRRIQLQRTKGWRKPADTIVVTRPGKWGNPFAVKVGADPADVVELYRQSLYAGRARVSIDDVRRELRGKNLACWCKPGAPCHADVLLAIANA